MKSLQFISLVGAGSLALVGCQTVEAEKKPDPIVTTVQKPVETTTKEVFADAVAA